MGAGLAPGEGHASGLAPGEGPASGLAAKQKLEEFAATMRVDHKHALRGVCIPRVVSAARDVPPVPFGTTT